MGKEEGKMKYSRGCEGVKITKEGSRRKEVGQRQTQIPVSRRLGS